MYMCYRPLITEQAGGNVVFGFLAPPGRNLTFLHLA